jgi:hypothetical protein
MSRHCGGRDVMSAGPHVEWLQLSEAVQELAKRMTEANAKAWVVRMIKDRLRGDPARYGKQTSFRIPGYPMRLNTLRTAYDWPAELTESDLDFACSTIHGRDPVRIIYVDLLIEVAASALIASDQNAITEQKFKPASSDLIHHEIKSAYDRAVTEGKPAPNIKKLPKEVRPRLNAQGHDASDSQIMKLGNDQQYALRRGAVGVRVSARTK